MSWNKVVRRFLLWMIVGWISAAPSFLVAMQEFDVAAMVLAVFLFVAFLTAITCTRRFERIRARRFVRATLYAGYGTRVGISLALPVGFSLDLFPGLLSVGLVQGMGLEETGFLGTFLATLLQGTFLNTIVFLFMLVIYAACRLFGGKAAPEGCCRHCHYDLRGTPEIPRCPECGAPVIKALRPAA